MNNKLLAGLVIAITIGGSVVAGMVTSYLFPGLPENSPYLIAFSMSMILIYAGSSFMLFLGLKNFTPKFKYAYAVFCAGILLLAIGEMQLPVLTAMNLQDAPWMRNGGILLPIIVAIITMYVGVRRFSRMFGVQSVWNKGWFVALMAVLTGFAAFFLPVGPVTDEEIAARATLAYMGVSLAVFFAGALLAYKVQRMASKTYRQAFFWFFLAMAGFVVVTLQTIAGVILLGSQHPWMTNGMSILIQVVLALPLVRAAYEFDALENVAATDKPMTEISILDVVVAAAEKVSNPKAIEPQLEQVREITAGITPGQKIELDAQVANNLAGIYKQIEHYLTQEEPVRRYQPEELRKSILRETGASNPTVFAVVK